MREHLRISGVPDPVVDDAVLILSELLSNSCRHGRPRGDARTGGDVLAAWRVDAAGRLTVEVTDGGGPTRPVLANPSVTARGGRGLSIITALADDWGVRDDDHGEVTVWVLVHRGAPVPPTRVPDGTTRVNGRTVPRSDGASHPAGTGKGARRSGTASHGHRPAYRHGGELAAHRTSRPVSSRADHDFADPYDEPE